MHLLDNLRGYEADNVVLVCACVSNALGTWGVKTFDAFAVASASRPRSFQRVEVPEQDMPFHDCGAGGFDCRNTGPKHLLTYLCCGAKQRNATRNDERSAPAFVQHCLELFTAQAGACAVSGLPMTWTNGCAYRISIDRISNTKGYIAGNVRLVCVFVNNALGTAGMDEYYAYMAARARTLTNGTGNSICKVTPTPERSIAGFGAWQELPRSCT